MKTTLSWLLFLCLFWSGTSAWAADMSCEQAASVVERTLDIPEGLLAAIARVESGNHPFAVNVNGLAVQFARRSLATDAVRTMLESGAMGQRPRVDVGCFQINLGWHPHAFSSVEDGFNPLSNGLAAGLLLRQLHLETHDWRKAVARYHAASQEGVRYAQTVFQRYERNDPSVTFPESVHAGWVKTASSYGITVYEPEIRE